jgi:predicted naringenin-chalcone synthase
LSKIVSIGTAVPAWKHQQHDILDFMQRVYAPAETDKRKLRFLYRQSGIDTRYSVIPDFSLPAAKWQFFHPTENLEPFATLEDRMQWYKNEAAPLSIRAINDCLYGISGKKITHLITVSCTGMSAPGLDIELIGLLELPPDTFHTSVNFMGCYAAIHALKMANAFCKNDKSANVLIVCTELCTLHFQKEYTVDNITSSLLFSDGSAAVLVSGDDEQEGLTINNFYSLIEAKGKQDMAWQLSSSGFKMTLTSYVADLIESSFDELTTKALEAGGIKKEEITHWCIHPGGKKILEAVHNSLGFSNGQLQNSYDILRQYGNMSSATILFVLKDMMKSLDNTQNTRIFGAAFGPGLTTETFILSA